MTDLEQLLAENARLAEALVEAMIVPESWLISGRPIGTSDEAWQQIQRSVHFARAALSADPAPVAGVTVQEAAKVLAEAMSLRMWQYYPIEMPVTKEGCGPATIGVDAASIEYEVWRATDLSSIGSYKNLPDAITSALRAIAGENGNENG